MQREIKVTVTKYADRKNLVMYYRDPTTERIVARSTGTRKWDVAQRVAALWEAEVRGGRRVGDTRLTWEAFRERYEDEKLCRLSHKYQKQANTAFNHLEKLIDPKRLRSLTAGTLSRFQKDLRATGIKETSIATYLRPIQAALNWAVKMKLLDESPIIETPKQSNGQRLMRGRPITTEEFERMLGKIEEGLWAAATADRALHREPAKRHLSPAAKERKLKRQSDQIAAAVPQWRRLLMGLWLSGLRLEESTIVCWDDEASYDAPFVVDLSGRRPRFRIYAEAQKGRRDQYLPLTPDFAELLLSTPADERHGRLFKVDGLKNGQPLTAQQIGRVISKIGEKAGVVVERPEGKAKCKYGSAHDLRRAFGTRWSRRVAPAVLQKLMRHKSIETTMKYYVDLDADDLADQLWQDHVSPAADAGFNNASTPPAIEPEIDPNAAADAEEKPVASNGLSDQRSSAP